MRIASGQPLAFISYARRDDVAYRGKISEFRHYLELLAGAALGRDFQIRQDISAIGWGQHWPSRLNELLDSASLLIPFITPSFFTSDVCPLELEKFLELERRTGRRDLVLPVYFRTAPELETGSHPLARVLLERQIRDWRELRYLPLEQTEVLRALDGLADEIAETIRRLEQASAALPDARARLRLGRLPEAEEPVHAAGLEKASQWPAGRIFGDRDQRWCPEMIVVPTGSFPMGSPPDEEGRLTNEGPLHRVYISRAFALGRFPVTFEEFGH